MGKKKLRKIISLLMSIMLVCTVIPIDVMANNDAYSESGESFTQPDVADSENLDSVAASESNSVEVNIGGFSSRIFVYASPNIEFRSDDEDIVQCNNINKITNGGFTYYTVDFWGIKQGNAAVRSYDPDTDTYLELIIVSVKPDTITQEVTVGENFTFNFASLNNYGIESIGYSQTVTNNYDYTIDSYDNHERTIFLYTVNLTLHTPGTYTGYVFDTTGNVMFKMELNVVEQEYETITIEMGSSVSIDIPYYESTYDYADPPDVWDVTEPEIAMGYMTGISYDGTQGMLSGQVAAYRIGTTYLTVSMKETGAVLAKYKIVVIEQTTESASSCVDVSSTFTVKVPQYMSADNISIGFSQDIDYNLVKRETLTTDYNGNIRTILNVTLKLFTIGNYSLYFINDNEVIKEINLSIFDHEWQSPTVDLESTCTQEGRQSIHCSICDTIKENSEEPIAMLEHQWGNEFVQQEPSCTETGILQYSCVECGLEKQEEIPAIGHIWNPEPTIDIEASCVSKGNQSIHCSVCDAIKEGSKEDIAEKGHSWNAGEIIKESTCTESGEKIYTCTACNELIVEEISALGHDWAAEVTVDKEPTCTSDGSQGIHCLRCYKMKNSEIIPAKGHTWNDEIIRKPTCTIMGLKRSKCINCSTIKMETIPLKEHKWDAGRITSEPTYTTYGSIVFTCTDCKKTRVETIPMKEQPPTPVLKKAASYSYNKIKITWEKVQNAKGYRIYRKTGNGSWKLIKEVAGSNSVSYIDMSAVTNTSYTYTVRAYWMDDGKKILSKYDKTGVSAKAILNKSVITSITNLSPAKLTINWKKISGANGYRVYRINDDGSYKYVTQVSNSDTLSYTESGLSIGQSYTYKVRAYRTVNKKRVYGSYSDAVTGECSLDYPASPELPVLGGASSYSYNKIKVIWNTVKSAEGYRVYRKTAGGSWKTLKTISDSKTMSFIDATATTGTTYYYTVRAYRKAYDKTLWSGYDKVGKSAKAVPSKSVINSINNKIGKTLKLNWKKVPGASGYRIYQIKSDGSDQYISQISKGSTLTYTHKGLKKGETYQYKIRAYRIVNGKRVYGAYSDIKSAKVK